MSKYRQCAKTFEIKIYMFYFCFCFQIQTHKDFESLYDSVPQELLPSDYGGKEPPVSELIGNYLFIIIRIFQICLWKLELKL